MVKAKVVVISVILSLAPACALAWNGYDYESGSFVEIEKGNLVRTGRDIEYYDYKNGEYRSATVDSMRSGPGSVEVEVYDHQTGDYRTLEMDRPPSGRAKEMPGLPGLPSLY
ncbi:DUF5334 family protein [Allopusillimonas ginsengisoli]|uniref:DUF5334 family protein n=1 Tax=Allopusillimonas ginsengisoli TaxID=453575 RepID=UPI0039C48E26